MGETALTIEKSELQKEEPFNFECYHGHKEPAYFLLNAALMTASITLCVWFVFRSTRKDHSIVKTWIEAISGAAIIAAMFVVLKQFI